jgi:two-component system sensor histidine kinase PilS (NtrC family)
MEVETYQVAYILGFASLQIFGATLVVVVIRSHMESLHTHLSRSEAAVDELSALYRRVFESMFSGLITADLAGRITSANPAAEKILHALLVPGDPIEPFGFGNLANLGTLLREQRFEVNFQSPDGARRIVGGNVAPLLGSEGEPTGHLLVFQDLTDLKALEERTRMSERLAAVGELSSEMAHELRNPLASILGCVQILKQGEQAKPMMDRILNILFRESQRVSALVTEFLDFTRPRPMRLETIALRAVADEVRASWETDPRNAGLDLHMDVPPGVQILGDKVWVHQVFTNLLSNARKAFQRASTPVEAGSSAPVPPAGFTPRIQVGFAPGSHGGSAAGHQGGQILATVADNGCGMSEERLRAVFIPFSSGFEEGTGLGMSLVFQFVQQMGWGIQVDSTLDAGTTVTLRIPTAPEGASGVEKDS